MVAAAGNAAGPASFGRLCAACDPAMIAYAQLEVMAMLPSLKVAKLQQPAKVDEADLKVCPGFLDPLSLFHLLSHSGAQKQPANVEKVGLLVIFLCVPL